MLALAVNLFWFWVLIFFEVATLGADVLYLFLRKTTFWLLVVIFWFLCNVGLISPLWLIHFGYKLWQMSWLNICWTTIFYICAWIIVVFQSGWIWSLFHTIIMLVLDYHHFPFLMFLDHIVLIFVKINNLPSQIVKLWLVLLQYLTWF